LFIGLPVSQVRESPSEADAIVRVTTPSVRTVRVLIADAIVAIVRAKRASAVLGVATTGSAVRAGPRLEGGGDVNFAVSSLGDVVADAVEAIKVQRGDSEIERRKPFLLLGKTAPREQRGGGALEQERDRDEEGEQAKGHFY